jgi:hypothetical protein
MPETLEVRFKKFLASRPDAEIIDEIIPPGDYEGKKRADYLLANRKVILELKNLETDISPKAQKEIDKHEHRKDFPFIYGKVDIQKILQHLPDGQEINKRIYELISRTVEGAIRSAEDQIMDTKEILHIDHAIGFLVLLNEDVDILNPEVIAHKTSQLLCRERGAKSPPLQIHFVWLLLESHSTKLRDGRDAPLSVLLEAPLSKSASWFGECFEQLQEDWARFNGVPLVRSNAKRIAELDFRYTKGKRKDSQNLTRQEYWEQKYKANPHLRSLSDEELLVHGAQVIKKLSPYFLKDGPRLSIPELEPQLIAWSDFLQEARFRGLDLRRLQVDS